jgi:uncharacterized protein YdeI (YjbR/CyaY-like superfamily)
VEIGKTLYVTNRTAWRAWLAKHHESEPEIWLIFYKKSSGKPRISYDDAVLEALCYGWIDSIVKTVDDESFAQRFSPRKSHSNLSQMNKVRLQELIKAKKMTKAGLDAIAGLFDPVEEAKKAFTISPGILKALQANPDAWKYFQTLPESYKRIRIEYIESRKRHGVGMYTSALNNFVKMTAQNKRIGFVKERR